MRTHFQSTLSTERTPWRCAKTCSKLVNLWWTYLMHVKLVTQINFPMLHGTYIIKIVTYENQLSIIQNCVSLQESLLWLAQQEGEIKGAAMQEVGGLWYVSGSFCLYFNVPQEVLIHKFLLHLKICGFVVWCHMLLDMYLIKECEEWYQFDRMSSACTSTLLFNGHTHTQYEWQQQWKFQHNINPKKLKHCGS